MQKAPDRIKLFVSADIILGSCFSSVHSNPPFSLNWFLSYFVCLLVVNQLLDHPDIDVNSADCVGETALSKSSLMGHVWVVRELLKHSQTDVNTESIRGMSPLMYALMKGHHDVLESLLHHRDIDTSSIAYFHSTRGETALEVATRYGFPDCINLIKNHKNNQQPKVNVETEVVVAAPSTLDD